MRQIENLQHDLRNKIVAAECATIVLT